MYTQTFERDRILDAANNEVLVVVNNVLEAAGNEVLYLVDGIELIEPDVIYEKDGARFATLDDEAFEVLAFAINLRSMISDTILPQVTVALLSPEEVDRYWNDPDLHIIIARGVVLGPLDADGRSRRLTSTITITQEEDGWVMRSPEFWWMFDIRR